MKDFYQLGDKIKNLSILRQFVDEHFDEPGMELVEYYPEDWDAFPSSFLKIQDYKLRRWALHLHRIWRDLCRKVRFRFLKLFMKFLNLFNGNNELFCPLLSFPFCR